MAADPIEPKLDALHRSFRETAAFDVSPRGVRVRPGAETDAALDDLRASDEAAVAGIAARLHAAAEPFDALMWLYCLAALGTPAARTATEAFVDAIKREGRWRAETPGLRDILLFTGYEA